MKLIKTSEQVNRTFVDGEQKDIVTGATFDIKDGDQTIGSAQTYQYGYILSIDGSAENVEAAEAAMKKALGIE